MWSTKGKKKLQKRSANVKNFLGGGLAAEAENNNDNNSHSLNSGSAHSISQPQRVLVEIPEELDIAESSQQQNTNHYRKHDTKDDSAAISEIGNNLDDLDNYMMSVFYNTDDAISTAETSYSCSVSSTSTISTRRRHRGAANNRRKDPRKDNLKQQNSGSSNWLESMRNSSMNIFVDGEDGWTPSKGWSMSKKKEFDAKPDEQWSNMDPFFDSISKERLEI